MNINCLQTGPFGINTWLVPLCGNKVLVFDPGACSFTGDAKSFLNFFASNKLEPAVILLTHGHFDHITGTAAIKEAFPMAPLICHKADASMTGSSAADFQRTSLEAMGLEMLSNALVGLPDPDVLFDREVTLDTLVETQDPELRKALAAWKVLHTPGHTPGSVCWYNESEKILVSGDTIFFHSWGRTDLKGGSEAQLMGSLKRIYGLIPDDVRVYPGHEHAGFHISENR